MKIEHAAQGPVEAAVAIEYPERATLTLARAAVSANGTNAKELVRELKARLRAATERGDKDRVKRLNVLADRLEAVVYGPNAGGLELRALTDEVRRA